MHLTEDRRPGRKADTNCGVGRLWYSTMNNGLVYHNNSFTELSVTGTTSNGHGCFQDREQMKARDEVSSQPLPCFHACFRPNSLDHKKASYDYETSSFATTSSDLNLQTYLLAHQELQGQVSNFAQRGPFRLPPSDVSQLHGIPPNMRDRSQEAVWVKKNPEGPEIPPPTPPGKFERSPDPTFFTTCHECPGKSVSTNAIHFTSDNFESKRKGFEAKTLIEIPVGSKCRQQLRDIEGRESDSTSNTVYVNWGTSSGSEKGDGSSTDSLIVTTSSCSRCHKPISISFLTIGAIMLLTFSVLYWNYYETMHRRLTKKHGHIILDHWGKGAPSKLETSVLLKGLQESVDKKDDIYEKEILPDD